MEKETCVYVDLASLARQHRADQAFKALLGSVGAHNRSVK